MKKSNGVSVVVLHYGHGNEVFKCLDSLAKVKEKVEIAEIILVDNNEEKTDRSNILKKYPWVKYMPAPKNLGWSGGHNLGFEKAKGEYIFSLDSDVLIDAKSFRNIYEELKSNKKRGIVSPRIRNISGKAFGSATREMTPMAGIFYLSFLKRFFPGNLVAKNHLIEGWNRKTSRNVEAIQLGAFMIKKEAYKDIGGFDDNLFLYFGENDVSNRLRKKGWELFFDSKSEAIHLESQWTPKNTVNIKRIWAKDRFYYFKKHYGVLNAYIVEMFARMDKWTFLFLLILIFGTFLRFFKIQQNLVFNGEMGYDYMTIENFVMKHQIPLIGPRTSHEWFFIGPIFYWIFGLLLPLFHYSVYVGAYFFAVIGVITILVGYLVVKSLFGEKPAMVSAFLISFSPLWVALAHDARFNGLTALLFFPFYFLLVRSVEDKGKSLFFLGLTLGVMFSFFPSPILLLPGSIVTLFIYRKNIDVKNLWKGILGLLIPVAPWLLYNIEHRFDLLTNILIWIPYRVLGFFGFYPKNTATPNILLANFTGLYNFFQSTYLYTNNILIFALFATVLSFVFFKIKRNLALNILLIVSGVSFLGLFLHGNPPSHYYLVIYPVPVIFLSLFLTGISKKLRWVFVLVLAGLFIFNLKYFFSDKWFFVDTQRMSSDMTFVPYNLQVKVADFIVKDAKGKSFSIGRVGPLDYFGENFSLNYQYLLRNMGNAPNDNSGLKYTIYEDTRNLPGSHKVYWIENIAVGKNE